MPDPRDFLPPPPWEGLPVPKFLPGQLRRRTAEDDKQFAELKAEYERREAKLRRRLPKERPEVIEWLALQTRLTGDEEQLERLVFIEKMRRLALLDIIEAHLREMIGEQD